MADKLSDRLEIAASIHEQIGGQSALSATIREAAELARSVEDAAVVEINSDADDVRLIAEGGPLDRMATSLRVIGMHGQRVRLVPEPPEE